jgi:UDP-glucose 4-epimerase
MDPVRKMVITGVAGLIGSHLADALLEREDTAVVGIDNLSVGIQANIAHLEGHPLFKFHQACILEPEAWSEECLGAEWIVHLAASKKIGEQGSRARTIRVNGEGTLRVLDVAHRFGCRALVASTSDVYGLSAEIPFREDGELVQGPTEVKRWSYAASKLFGEQVALAYCEDHDVPVVILRYFGGFSERSSPTWSGGHIPLFVDAVLNDKEVTIHGDGKQTRCMGYVSDLVDGTLRAIEAPQALGEVINVGTDEEHSVLEAAHRIHALAATGNPLQLSFVPHAELFGEYREIPRRVPDLSKAHALLGYHPQVSFEEGIRHTLASWRDRKATYPPGSRSAAQ